MSAPVTLPVTFSTAVAAGITASQALAAAGNLTIGGTLASGGVATLTAYGVERPVIITSAGNDSGITFTVYGTNASGNPVQQTVTGTNAGVATTTTYFYQVTRIAASGAVATTVTAGTSGVMASRWLVLNYNAAPFTLGIGVVVSGTINYTLQYTYDDVQVVSAPTPSLPAIPVLPTAWDLTALASKTANTDSSITAPVTAVRLKINSGTAPASATATIIQAGLGSP